MSARNARIIIDCFCDAEGSAKVGNRIWRWEFHEFLGPTFVDKKGNSVNSPSEHSPVWNAFNDWLWKYYTEKKNIKALAAMRAWYPRKAAV